MSSTTKYYAELFKRCINYYYFHVFSSLLVCVGTCACVFMDVYVSSLGLAQAGFKPEALFLHQLT